VCWKARHKTCVSTTAVIIVTAATLACTGHVFRGRVTARGIARVRSRDGDSRTKERTSAMRV
jgi:hypothetical protein